MDEFRCLAKILKNAFPDYDISVRRVKMADRDLGDCEKKGRKFKIRISNQMPETQQFQILIHEFAHVLSWDDPKDHGISWAKAYSKVYNIYINEYLNEPE